MGYKLWISQENLGVLKHIENLGGAYSKLDDNTYYVTGVPAWRIREMRNIFCLSAPRTPIEDAYLDSVRKKFA